MCIVPYTCYSHGRESVCHTVTVGTVPHVTQRRTTRPVLDEYAWIMYFAHFTGNS